MNIEPYLDDFATRSFRDVADHDYISARMAYRHGLYSQFYWSGLQAVEKYLKAILLYNRIVAKDVRHSLKRALQHASKLPFELELRKEAHVMMERLDTFGRFRYLESSYYVRGPMLAQLDCTVWEVRRYCTQLKRSIVRRNGEKKSLLSSELLRVSSARKNPPQEFELHGGALEKILAKQDHPARAQLVWKNLFYGASRRTRVAMPVPFHATNSPLTLHPEILDHVLKYVFLPKEVVDAYSAAK